MEALTKEVRIHGAENLADRIRGKPLTPKTTQEILREEEARLGVKLEIAKKEDANE